ncbi:Polyketide cyclase / dehydrase and lipid transport [Erythrobacter litoralis]|uniref:Cyclase n=1 Tax=Erythrobacter litoralis TaxID=39960 RepID=A0A074MDL1_9SPHN|nr:SRPBCC family protein [Erythrobacter litoralis]AOL22778.1 Polyketide cyclase / dehydrase and lipid transport [Erythrobacter litoralis]KEO92921.1 cyclase [Erythrobacter litoralis]
MTKAASVLDRLPGGTRLDREGLRDLAQGSSSKLAAEGRKAIGRGKRALSGETRPGEHARKAGEKVRENPAGIAGALTGIALLAGTVAFGAFLARRHKGGDDDAPGVTRKRTDSDNAVGGRTVTIRRPAAELYRFWRDFQNLPQFMENVEEVRPHGDHEAWVVKAPGGRTVELHTRVTEEIENRRIAWESVQHSDIWTKGHVEFSDAPGDRGTRVSLRIEYAPPGGAIGKGLAKLFLREPEVQARHDLKRFKMLMEAGEVATSAHTKQAAKNVAHQQEIA